MNRKLLLIISLFITILLSFSCNNEKDEEAAQHIYLDLSVYRNTIFVHGGGWDEVEYSDEDPSKFTLHKYYAVSHGNSGYAHCCSLSLPLITDIYCDSTYIGQIEYNIDYQVLFTDSITGESRLMYDFLPLIENRKQWIYDTYGGKTIKGLGSTKGIFVPLAENPKQGFTREVIRCYLLDDFEPIDIKPLKERYGDSIVNYFIKINQCYYPGCMLYLNTDSPIAHYLPEDF